MEIHISSAMSCSLVMADHPLTSERYGVCPFSGLALPFPTCEGLS